MTVIFVFTLSKYSCICAVGRSFFKGHSSFISFPFSFQHVCWFRNWYRSYVCDFFSAFILYELLLFWKGKVNFLLAFFHVCEGYPLMAIHMRCWNFLLYWRSIFFVFVCRYMSSFLLITGMFMSNKLIQVFALSFLEGFQIYFGFWSSDIFQLFNNIH